MRINGSFNFFHLVLESFGCLTLLYAFLAFLPAVLHNNYKSAYIHGY